MRDILFVTTVALEMLVGAGIAHADWIDDAWSEDSARVNGNPAVSISGDTIYLALPSATLQQAYDAGLSTKDALHRFLDRHGQRCSQLIDLNFPHPHLRVMLSLQDGTPFENLPEGDEVLGALKRAYLRYHTDGSSPLLFTVSPVKFEFSINYVPTRRVRCIAPGDIDGPTS